MYRFLLMNTHIEHLPVRLKRRPGSTQNKGKTNAALVTNQISNSASFFHNFETRFGRQNPSDTEF